jgi:SAM-dependent methyltransferase
MPNDEAEQTRLNIVHQIYLILLNGNLTAVPISSGAPRILDIGTGPGDWVIEMSALHPEATFIASDIGVFDAGIGHIDLPNVFFQLDDARDEWTYDQPFDLVHLRGLSGAFQDWRHIYEQAFKHLNPGGYIEVSDEDPAGDTVTLPNSNNSYLSIYASAMRSAAEAAGYPRDLSHLRPAMLSAAGFVDVRVLEREVPIGLWPVDIQEKTLGKMVLIALLEGLEAYSLRHLTATSKWTPDQVRDLCDKVKRELMTARKMTGRIRILTGRKPISSPAKRIETHNCTTA